MHTHDENRPIRLEMWLSDHVYLACNKPWSDLRHQIKAGVDYTSVIAVLWSWRQGGQKFKLILGYIVGFIWYD